MKNNKNIFLTALVLIVLAGTFGFINKANTSVNGAWRLQTGSVEQVLILNEGYFMHTTFDKTNKKFIESRGGAYTFSGNNLSTTIEFNTSSKEQVGQQINYDFAVSGNKLISNLSGMKASWSLIDNGKAAMAGTWRSSGRLQDGKVVLNPPRARKTFKILTGTRFQWAAINAETKEFFGTGGGTYTFKDGKYTENIEFFSRDSSRVGASLTFDGKLDGDLWHHSGMSSKRTPIYEIWKMEPKN